LASLARAAGESWRRFLGAFLADASWRLRPVPQLGHRLPGGIVAV